jgi:tRNA pseudouridine55 synthase
MSIDGFLNVNKPEGRTSYSLVAWLKKLTREKQVGHTGTLDPLATGVLPICLGPATRLSHYLIDSDKVYIAQIQLGITTDTLDAEGQILERRDITAVTRESTENIVNIFQGTIEQTPPRYSALKSQGVRYYELARQGIPIQPKPRIVRIFEISMTEFNPPLVTIRVKCGKGTYIRSLAHDLGQKLGCGAFLRKLVRTQTGPFYIEQAYSMDKIEDVCNRGIIGEILYPMDTPLLHLSTITVNKDNESAVRHGRSIMIHDNPLLSMKGYCRAYTAEGALLALLRYNSLDDLWHPEKVFSI